MMYINTNSPEDFFLNFNIEINKKNRRKILVPAKFIIYGLIFCIFIHGHTFLIKLWSQTCLPHLKSLVDKLYYRIEFTVTFQSQCIVFFNNMLLQCNLIDEYLAGMTYYFSP